MEYIIKEGFERIAITSSDTYQMTFTKNANVIIDYDGSLDLQWDVTVTQDVKATILFLNHSSETVKTNEVYHVKKDASLTVAYCELMLNPIQHTTKVYLEETGAVGNVHTATVCGDKVSYDVAIQHLAPYTQSNMENYGIVMKGAHWDVVATGQIKRGCYQSKAHQTTRILTLDEKQNVKVLPILLIDENDVEASHACSLGQPDENQLYYMQSRGMNRTQAIQLLTIGYLLPIATIIDDETVREEIREEIEKKVQLCKM